MAAPPPISLALVITELDVGGAETCLVNLATGLPREQFAPVVYSLGPRPREGDDGLVRRLEQASVPTHFLCLRSRWQFLSAVSKLKRLLARQQPQIMQSFLFHANVVGTLAARWAGVPNVVTGIRVADPSGWRQRAERWLAPRMDRIVCVSESVASFCRETCRLPAEKLVVIPNGVDLARFENLRAANLAELGRPAGRRALLYVGRLDRQKGLDWLFENCLPQIFRELPEHDLLVVGDGPQRNELQRIASAKGFSERVHFAGRRWDVPEIMAASDVLLLPSRWEGMPNVVLEAMAAGLAVVATQAEGVMELLGPAGQSQIVSPGDAAAFVERVVKSIFDRANVVVQTAANKARASEQFSLRAMIGSYEALYEELSPGTGKC